MTVRISLVRAIGERSVYISFSLPLYGRAHARAVRSHTSRIEMREREGAKGVGGGVEIAWHCYSRSKISEVLGATS